MGLSGLWYKHAIRASSHYTEPCYPGDNAITDAVTDTDSNRDTLCTSHAAAAAARARCSARACRSATIGAAASAAASTTSTTSELLPQEQRGNLLPTWRILPQVRSRYDGTDRGRRSDYLRRQRRLAVGTSLMGG